MTLGGRKSANVSAVLALFNALAHRERMLTPLTHRRLLAISLPIIAANITVPLLGAVDAAIIGQLGNAALMGAVGFGAVILSALTWIFGFLRMGTTGLVAQARGAGDTREAAALLTRALVIAGVGGAALILFQGPIFWAVLAHAPSTAEVSKLTRDYLQIRIWAAPATIALYAVTGWLIAAERGRAVLVLQLVMNGGNAILTLFFVLGLGWGVAGAALATALAEVAGLGLGLWMLRATLMHPAARDRVGVLDPARLRHMFAVNRDIMIRSALLMAMMTSFAYIGSGMGDATLAANQALMHFIAITAFALDGIAFAAETLVGQAKGAGDRRAFRRASVLGALWGGVAVCMMALLFGVLGGQIIALMTTSQDVREVARDFLPWMVAAPLLGLAAWILDGVFIGATETAEMRNMMALSAIIYLVALLVLVPSFGNHGLWAALLISYIARGLSLGLRYSSIEARVPRSSERL